MKSCVQDGETGNIRDRRASEEQNNESQKQKVPASILRRLQVTQVRSGERF